MPICTRLPKSMPSISARKPCTKCWRDCSPSLTISMPASSCSFSTSSVASRFASARASPACAQGAQSIFGCASQKGLGRLPAIVVSSMRSLLRLPLPLQRLAAYQARQRSAEPHGLAHEAALQGLDSIDQPKPDIAREADGGDVVREQTIEPVGGEDQRQRVGAAPGLEAFEHRERADIEAEATRIDQHLGQRRD